MLNDARSGHVNAKMPNDWIVLRPTPDTDVFHAEIGRFLLIQKSFRIDLQTGEVTALSAKPAG